MDNRKKRLLRFTARTLLFVLAYELVLPNVMYALTTGPSQPEVQSFEPVGTTDMVDMFSGDFVYNIPLLDVEGYPVNISYHGGVSMEQEASWVGLGWNINPGTINRTVRGIPDDFNGDTLDKQLNIRPENIIRMGLGGGVEVFGVGPPVFDFSVDGGVNLNISNYKGVSCDFSVGAGISVFNSVSAGVNIGVGSQMGAEIDYNAGLSFSSSQIESSDVGGGFGVNVGSGYNTRTGLKAISLSISTNATVGGQTVAGTGITATVPIGTQNYVPVITNTSTMTAMMGKIKLGGELFWCNIYGDISGMLSTLSYGNNSSRDAYGYLYLQNAPFSNTSILDFTRDKDGSFNKSMEYLPCGNLTYDIYSVSGQGTSGNYRPFRNDFGSVYDPVVANSDESTTSSGSAEGSIGWNFEGGGDGTQEVTNANSGPWSDYCRAYQLNDTGSVYENTYFKQAGELTTVDPAYFSAINGFNVLSGDQTKGLPDKKPNSTSNRDARGNLMYYFTAQQASIQGVGTSPNIINYIDTPNYSYGPTFTTQPLSRIGTNPLQRKKDQISEIMQVQKDGKRYVYGIPAMNSVQKECTFSVNAPTTSADSAAGIVHYAAGDDGTGNPEGIDNYYSGTITPSYAHSYLLTSVLSPDYVDVTGDGITDDDLGSYTKFNYSLKEPDYRWRAPYTSGTAQFNPGYWSDPNDDKGSYLIGSREEWILHSIETKNFIAEFYTSKRQDGQGSKDAIVTTGGRYSIAPYNQTLTQAASSYKLDSIKLFNKHDRFINGTNAVPIKTVYLEYNYTLCAGVPNFNGSDSSKGKLTLTRIYTRYGTSQRSMLSPYQFSYGYNPPYDLSAKDRWGNFKPNNAAFTNYEFPFVNQNDANDNTYAGAWSLNKITLPSGGTIVPTYESDDYAYVQDQPADEMFMVQGVGMGKYFQDNGRLYENANDPDLYVYFSRRTASELSNLSFAQNYTQGLSSLFFSFNVEVNNETGAYEQVKGYANIADVGVCPDNTNYGYIRLQPVETRGGEAYANPVTYTAINLGRYNLPQVIYPGFNKNASDLHNILSGLKQSFKDLLGIAHNPIVWMIDQNDMKYVNINKSFIRLASPGMAKKGGGQRVKTLQFYDSWNALAGGNEQQATYGKQYNYTINDQNLGVISSGVASYEPMIGGDENPFRNPIKYTIPNGNKWPPNDPEELYQDAPLGESLFPSPTVGYRQVTVTSVNAAQGRSSQGVDLYQFYTAKDYPLKINAGPLNVSENQNHMDLFNQQNLFAATQGYTFTFNDMHGKPKRVEHDEYMPQGQTMKTLSYQQYYYNGDTLGNLSNNVNVMVYDPGSNRMVERTQQLGLEGDVTVDTRQKDETSHQETFEFHMNVATIPLGFIPLVIPVPWPYGYGSDNHTRFRSEVTTKVIQQYGILNKVVSYNEGALTTVSNEVFDPNTGQAIVTSVNNEFQDPEYTVKIPAYWGYKNMGPAYMNTGYVDQGTLTIRNIVDPASGNTALYGVLDVGSRASNYNVGDELLVTYGGNQTIAWVMQPYPADTTWGPGHSIQMATDCCQPLLAPRNPMSTAGWTNGSNYNATVQVIRSGRYNQLTDNMEEYTMLSSPVDASQMLKDTLDNLISIKATTYADNNTQLLYPYIGSNNLNPFAMGAMGIFRPATENVYKGSRNYNTSSTRTAGLFTALNFWTYQPQPLMCGYIEAYSSKSQPFAHTCDGVLSAPYLFPAPLRDLNWRTARTVTKYSPTGKEVEDLDATGIYSTAQYGYEDELPVAIASNAKQGEMLFDGFEDYNLLQVQNNLMKFLFSPFATFGTTNLGSSPYYIFNLQGSSTLPGVVKNVSHTGLYSYLTPATKNGGGSYSVYQISLPASLSSYPGAGNYYMNHPWMYNAMTGPTVADEYSPFRFNTSKSYIVSVWLKPLNPAVNATDYSSLVTGVSAGVVANLTVIPFVKNSNVIDGWQQYTVTFPVSATATLYLPLNFYVDDIRIFPADANMKSFVYNPANEKLMATLDENNFATIYEYDQEGNLVRTKKETEKGIMTVSESRSSNPKQ